MITHVRAALASVVGNPTRKLLLVTIADHANADGCCWLKIETLQARAELRHARHVHSHLRRLEADGVLLIERRPGRTSLYRLARTPDATVTPDHTVTGDAAVTPPLTVQSPTPDGTVTQKKYLSTNEAPPRSSARSRTPRREVASSTFAEFWRRYPRKVAKAAALKAWCRIAPSATDATTILAALDQQVRSTDWQRDEGRFVPYPATWLNGRRWEDEAAPSPDVDAGLAASERFFAEEQAARAARRQAS